MSNARNLARLLPNTSGQLPDANLAAIAAGKVSGQLPDSAMSSGSVIQVAHTFFEGLVTTSNGGAPLLTSGALLCALDFTPQDASSQIYVLTSTVNIAEESNAGDRAWLGAWAGSTLIAANSGNAAYYHYGGNYNLSHLSLNNNIGSWGTTTRTIWLRGGMDGASCVINGNTSYSWVGQIARIGMTVMEVKP